MDVGGEARTVRAAENQSIFRDVNERVDELNREHAVFSEVSEWVCECADASCTERISMTMSEYESVRAHPNKFAVVPGHELLDVEFVIEANERFVTVSKIGAGASKARELDPRSGPR
jgi:hypothetical protein